MMRSRHIVIVDDEPNIGRSLQLILEGDGHRVTVCESAAKFHAERRRSRADLYLLDIRLPDGNGIDLLRSLRQGDDATPVVMISGHGTIRDAIDATRSGAFDFLEKPLARDRVLLVTKNALHFAAGGGITADSDPDEELAETLHKAEGMRLAISEALAPIELSTGAVHA